MGYERWVQAVKILEIDDILLLKVINNEKENNFSYRNVCREYRICFSWLADVVRCPEITSEAEPIGRNTTRYGFTYYSSRRNEPCPAIKFVGADLNSTYTFSCYYEVSDGTRAHAKFTASKCSASSGFDSSGKCNNSDPGQCSVICAY